MIWSLSFWRNTAELVAYGAGTGVVAAYTLVNDPGWKAVGLAALSGGVLWFGKALASIKVGPQPGTPLVTAVVPHGWNPVDPLGE